MKKFFDDFLFYIAPMNMLASTYFFFLGNIQVANYFMLSAVVMILLVKRG